MAVVTTKVAQSGAATLSLVHDDLTGVVSQLQYVAPNGAVLRVFDGAPLMLTLPPAAQSVTILFPRLLILTSDEGTWGLPDTFRVDFRSR